MIGIKLFFSLNFTVEILAAELLFLHGTPHRKKRSIRIAASAVFCFLISWIFNFDVISAIAGNYYTLVMALRYLLIFGVSMLAVAFCYDCPPYQILVCGIGGYTVQHIAYAVHDLLQVITGLRTTEPFENGWSGLFYISSMILVYLGVYYALYFLIIKKINQYRESVQLWYILLMSSGILLNVIGLNLFSDDFTLPFLIMFRLLSVFVCVLCLSVIEMLLENRQLQKDRIFIEEKSRLQEAYYENLRKSMDATNRMCHDFKHQIARLKAEAGTANEEFDREIAALEKTVEDYDGKMVTGNGALDILIHEKQELCAQRQIRFMHMIDQSAAEKLEKRDLLTMVGNILDNAIEAVGKISDPEQRVVHFSMVRQGEMILIQSENYFSGDLVLREGIPETTKTEAELHGFGMKSIQMLVEKYSGSMEIHAEDGIFELNIVLPNM